MLKNPSDKILHLVMIKTLSKLRIQGNFLNLIKNNYKKNLQPALYSIMRNLKLPY